MSNKGLVENLQNLIDKYVRNVTQVSPEDRKGRYKAAFDKLKLEISKAALQVAVNRMHEPFLLPIDTPDEVFLKWHDMVLEKAKEHRHFIWKEHDAKAFCEACENEWDYILKYISEYNSIFRFQQYNDELSREAYEIYQNKYLKKNR